MEINIAEQSEELLRIKQRFGIVGNSPLLLRAVERAAKVAPIDLSVLVIGESGTGKEFFPKIIHALGPRKHNKYIAVNCGAIPEGTIDSELFGHEKGAFTGAVASRKGYFEEADGGTIFLDEVAELPLTTQARLLRVLETGEFIKVGSSEVQRTNIRVVAATNVNMLKAVEQGRFREDLYYRLSTVTISVPPLRERGNDIRLLARKFASDFAERYHTPQITFDEEAMRLMLHYRWPGNVRQLKNVVDQLALFDGGNVVTEHSVASHLPDISADYTPALKGETGLHSYGNEREILFNMIFRLQRELDNVRSELSDLRGKAHEPHGKPVEAASRLLAPVAAHTGTVVDTIAVPVDEPAVEPVTVDDKATLEETEKETIRRALQRNDGRRKATAQELNISERTLYRKIREYGLE